MSSCICPTYAHLISKSVAISHVFQIQPTNSRDSLQRNLSSSSYEAGYIKSKRRKERDGFKPKWRCNIGQVVVCEWVGGDKHRGIGSLPFVRRSDDKCWKMLLFNYSISFDSHRTPASPFWGCRSMINIKWLVLVWKLEAITQRAVVVVVIKSECGDIIK